MIAPHVLSSTGAPQNQRLSWLKNGNSSWSAVGVTALPVRELMTGPQRATMTVSSGKLTRPDRMRWYADMRSVFDEHAIAWATWDYKSGHFGMRPGGESDQELVDILTE